MKKVIALILSFCFIFSAFAMAGITSSAEAYATEMPEQKEHGFITARDGAKIEYAIYGNLNAEPLVMLPCNGNDMHNFDNTLLPEMAEHFKVITVSPRGTGASERGEGALTFDVESDDLLFMLDELGIEKTHLFGFSDGGNLAIVFAVQHGDRVLSLIPMGANINDRGTKITNQIGIVFEYWILCIQAKLSDDPAIALQRDIKGMMVGQPVLKFKDLEKINVPTLNIYGESDMMYRTHSKKITKSIPGAKELMVKGGGHSSCFDYTHEILIPEILNFYTSNNFIK